MNQTKEEIKQIKELGILCGTLEKNQDFWPILVSEKIYHNEKLIGFVAIVRCKFIVPTFFINIHPDFQGKGLGTEISKKVLKKWKLPVILGVRKDNPPAIKLYKKLGFKIICTWWKKLDNKSAWLMAKF